MTKRHNRLAGVVRKAVEKFLVKDLRSEIQENQTLGQQGLSEEMRRLRPDMAFERRNQKKQRRRNQEDANGDVNAAERGQVEVEAEAEEIMESEEQDGGQILEIIEFSCPYGYISRGRNTLQRTYDEKKRKYAALAQELKRLRREERQERGQVRVTVVIVSSMGAVYGPSLKDLQKVLRCNNQELRKLGRKMAEVTVVGSMEIWRQYAKDIQKGTREEANQLIEEEVRELDQVAVEGDLRADIEDENANAEEDENEGREVVEDVVDREEVENENRNELDRVERVEREIEPRVDSEMGSEMEIESDGEIEVEVRVAGGERRQVPRPEEGQRENRQQGDRAEPRLQIERRRHVIEPEEGQIHRRVGRKRKNLGSVKRKRRLEVAVVENPADDEGEKEIEVDLE
jgi:hypothetical protein